MEKAMSTFLTALLEPEMSADPVYAIGTDRMLAVRYLGYARDRARRGSTTERNAASAIRNLARGNEDEAMGDVLVAMTGTKEKTILRLLALAYTLLTVETE
jgi:hypothetical protein